MPRRQRRIPSPPAAVPADARLLALDLEGWAGRHVAHAGHDLALLGKVVSLRLADEGATLQARVKDSGPHPSTVAIHAIDDGYAASCTCPWEEGPVCKHAVAAVEALRFPRPDVAHAVGVRAKPRRAGRLARGQGRIVTQAPVQAGTLLAAPGEVSNFSLGRSRSSACFRSFRKGVRAFAFANALIAAPAANG